MHTSDFDYDLPEELIAQTPLKDRASSRLLVVDKAHPERFSDHVFSDVIDYLKPGDALVLNETKVLPARIFGIKPETGGAVELLLLKDEGSDIWECLARPQKRLHPGTILEFQDEAQQTLLQATVLELKEEGITRVQFSYSGIFLEILDQLGTMPLPPYIHESLADQSRYQTVYAKTLGSAAAPTAGLHFTPELLQQIERKGIQLVKLTLHVGLGTFRPVSVEDPTKHKMHTEHYALSAAAAKTLNSVRVKGGRIVAVGTTSVRTLETVASKYHGKFQEDSGDTSIFIYPGYQFQGTDALITNFHLPRSTLLMLVSAFTSRTAMLAAYRHAVAEKYRFFSFGDAMLII